MNKCLVTKLSAAVNNDSLDKLGAIVFTTTEEHDMFVNFAQIGGSNTCTLEVSEGSIKNYHKTEDFGKVILNPTVSDLFFLNVNAGTVVTVNDKYSLKSVHAPYAHFRNADIKSFNILTNLTHLYIPHTNVYGKLGELAAFPFTELSLPDTVTGSIEEYVAAQRRAGRTTGTTTNSVYNTGSLGIHITFEGKEIYNETPKTILSWTPTTITLNGKTITA